MSAMDLAATMDALAAKLVSTGVTSRAFAWPEEAVPVPAAVVGYPETIEFDMTMGRGSDSATFPVWFLAGNVVGRATRDALSAIITGATGIKNAMDGPLTVGSGTSSVRVTECRIESVTIGAVSVLAARFDHEVIS